jgi:hypothetical protein
MKSIIAIGLACCIPIGLAAGDSDPSEANLGTMTVLVVDDSAPMGTDLQCALAPRDAIDAARCASLDRAVLTARPQEVSVLHERGRWM